MTFLTNHAQHDTQYPQYPVSLFSDFRPTMAYMDQYSMTYIAIRPQLQDQYDLSSIKGFVVCNSGSALSFKKALLERWPNTVVRQHNLIAIRCSGNPRLLPNTHGLERMLISMVEAELSV